jgi:SpoIID/LytB domain protein
VVLASGGGVCDARFSKCCGGATELFSTCWGDVDPPYLQSFADDPAAPLPDLADEATARAFVLGSPPAWCQSADRALLERLLPRIDHATTDFYRWRAEIGNEDLRGLVARKTGFDPGPVRALRPLRRGPSGRIVRLLVEGRDLDLDLGKELEIRRALSPTHLYSSAFAVEAGGGDYPARFVLHGAGWGHGVGLCQIGAAVMADRGHDHEAILRWYYRGAEITRIYD